MRSSTKAILAAAAGAMLLAGCADYGYYDNGYGYDNGYAQRNGYAYDNGYAYGNGYGNDGYAYSDYPGYYTGPSVGFGIGFSDGSDGHRDHWRDRDGHEHWRDRDHDRDHH